MNYQLTFSEFNTGAEYNGPQMWEEGEFFEQNQWDIENESVCSDSVDFDALSIDPSSKQSILQSQYVPQGSQISQSEESIDFSLSGLDLNSKSCLNLNTKNSQFGPEDPNLYPNKTPSTNFFSKSDSEFMMCERSKTGFYSKDSFQSQSQNPKKIAETNSDINMFYKASFTCDVAQKKVLDWLQTNHCNQTLRGAVRKFVDFYDAFFGSKFNAEELVTISKHLINTHYLTNDFLCRNLGVSKFVITKKSRKSCLARIASKLFIWQFLECNEDIYIALRS